MSAAFPDHGERKRPGSLQSGLDPPWALCEGRLAAPETPARGAPRLRLHLLTPACPRCRTDTPAHLGYARLPAVPSPQRTNVGAETTIAQGPQELSKASPPEVGVFSTAAPSGKRSPGRGREGVGRNADCARRQARFGPHCAGRRCPWPVSPGLTRNTGRPERQSHVPMGFWESAPGLERAGAVARRGGVLWQGAGPQGG